MGLIYGYSEAEERMRNENDKPNRMVAIDHDFYTNNKKAKARKDKEVAYAIKDVDGDAVGYYGREVRNKFAMGGQIKERRGFYD